MTRVLNKKGLGTVIGTVIFLLVALAILGSLLIIGYKEQLANVELSQAQTINSLKSQEQLQVSVHGVRLNPVEKIVTITNQGTVASQLLYLVVVPIGNNGQIAGQPIKVISLNVILQPGQSYTLKVNVPPSNNYDYGVITAYGNIFWNNAGG